MLARIRSETFVHIREIRGWRKSASDQSDSQAKAKPHVWKSDA